MLPSTTYFRTICRNPTKSLRLFSQQLSRSANSSSYFVVEESGPLKVRKHNLLPDIGAIGSKWSSQQTRKITMTRKMLNRITERTAVRTGMEESELASFTPAIRAHLRSVYTTLGGNVAVAGAASAIAVSSQIALSPGLGLIGGLGLVLGIGFTPAKYNGLRLGMLYGFSALEGLSLAPLIAASTAVAPGALPLALIGTGGIFAGFTGMSLLAKSRSMLSLGGPLVGGLLGIIAIQIAGFFFPSIAAVSHSISLYGGLALFSAYISYDTQRMIESARLGSTDVIGDSLSMFLNLANVFVRLLEIFSRRDQSDKIPSDWIQSQNLLQAIKTSQ